MANIVNAIINLLSNPMTGVQTHYINKNRINNMGDALEEYVKDLFSDAFYLDEIESLKRYNEVFSYFGNSNNPPDSILKLGDAIEVKKIESDNNVIALNSSYPKSKLYSSDKMLKKECVQCEDGLHGIDSNGEKRHWDIKDMIYVVGVVKESQLKTLCMVYGEDYAANCDTYERIKRIIKDGVEEIENVKFEKTKEIGKVKRVDPLGITYLRIRGMWGIENPLKVFEYVYKIDKTKKFNFMCIVNENKWNTFGEKEKSELQEIINEEENAKIEDVEIKDPNNPSRLKKAKLISFKK